MTVVTAGDASAALAVDGVGPLDPANNFPSYFQDNNGLALALCQDGLPNCLAGPELIQDVHAAGGDAEAFYYAEDATTTNFTLHNALEAAYAGDGPDQEVVFQRTQVTARDGGLPVNTSYTVTDPYGTFTCTTDAAGTIRQNACRIETNPVPGEFDRAVGGRLGPFLTWDTFASPTGAPPAGLIGDNTTPHQVVGSPTGFNAFRVQGPGLSGTCTEPDGSTIASCEQTNLFIIQGKVVDTGAPSAAVSQGTLDFGDIPGTPPVTKTLTYANTGTVPVTIGSVSVGGTNASAFAIDNQCPVSPATLAAGNRCSIDVTFTPEPGKSSAATLTITDDTPAASRNITLLGSNLPVMVVSDPAPPAAVAFSTIPVGSTSLEDNVVIGNTGVGPLRVASVTITGASAAHYKLGPNNTCTTPVAPDGGCEIGVQFAPTSTGSKTANLRVTDSNGKTVNVTLTGTGSGDTVAPTAPVLSGSVAGTTANLTWPAASDNVGVSGYQVFRGGVQQGANLAAAARSFSQAGLAPGIYSYTVRALDAAGNVSAASNAVSLTVPAPDTTAPTAPVLSGSLAGTTANLTWPAASDNVGVSGYQVFRGGVQQGANLAAAARSFSQAGLAPGTYSYTVRALDAAGNVSAASNAVSLTVPAANPPPTVTARTPAANATATAVASNLTATFSEPVTGVGTGTFQVRNPAGATIGGTVTRNGTTNQWILNPTANLVADTRYTVTLTGGATAIRDLAGAPLATTSWSFTTGPAPRVTARTPAVNAVAVGRTANVTATFSEAVAGVSATTFQLRNPAGASITATVTRSGTTNRWILNPAATLAANTVYRVNLTGGGTAIRDGAGNPLTNLTWTYTTGAT